jgi:hypothetical protein
VPELTSALIAAFSALLVAIVTAVAAIYAARIANRLEQQVALRTAEQRMTAYARLWQLTAVASPSRISPITASERQQLYDDITLGWYYEHGNGMVLTEPTRTLYLHAIDNLVCPDSDLFPPSLATEAPTEPTDRELWRGELPQDQLSLLRTQMKGDLAIFGRVYAGSLSSRDMDFLRECGLDPQQEPWKGSPRAGGRRRGYSRLETLPGRHAASHGQAAPAPPVPTQPPHHAAP